jgi:glycosyltransferase involved in cell wall biosynthesis
MFNTYERNDDIQLSLCIPTFNTKPYLDKLLNSILCQNLDDISYEILFLDDDSTDESFEYLCEIAKGKRNIRVLKNDKNSGISYTRNRLIENAKGEYIWFIDSDDMIYPGAIRELLNIAESNNADIVLANYIKVSEDACAPTKSELVNTEYEKVTFDNLDWLPDKDNNCRMLSMCRGIFKKEFLIANELYFNEKVIMKEDALLYYEIGMKSPNTIKCEFPCYCVRQRASSAMHGINEQKAKKYFNSSLALADAYRKHLIDQNYRDKDKLVDLIEIEKEQLVKYLLRISDKNFVNEQFKLLKSRGLYPYKSKNKKSTGVYRIMDLLLPSSFGFHLVYCLFRIKK